MDIGLRFAQLSTEDKKYVIDVCKTHLNTEITNDGLGIEIRYNFNPNDSSRLRKDVDMANKLIEANLHPIYLIFSSISPRDEAISRLTRAGWEFLVGQKALDFATELLGLNLSSVLDRPAVSREIKNDIDAMMKDIRESYAFGKFLEG